MKKVFFTFLGLFIINQIHLTSTNERSINDKNIFIDRIDAKESVKIGKTTAEGGSITTIATPVSSSSLRPIYLIGKENFEDYELEEVTTNQPEIIAYTIFELPNCKEGQKYFKNRCRNIN